MNRANAPPEGPYLWDANPPRHARFVSEIDQGIACARARRIGNCVTTDLLTSAVCLWQPWGLVWRGRSVPKAKRPSPTGVLLTATPTALAADRGGGAWICEMASISEGIDLREQIQGTFEV
jgi:hypothetical protein